MCFIFQKKLEAVQNIVFTMIYIYGTLRLIRNATLHYITMLYKDCIGSRCDTWKLFGRAALSKQQHPEVFTERTQSPQGVGKRPQDVLEPL